MIMRATTTLAQGQKHPRTSISIAREVSGPLDECATLVLSARHSKAANGAEHTAIGELGLRGDDGPGDVMVDGLFSRSA
jgi:hypothetical protein